MRIHPRSGHGCVGDVLVEAVQSKKHRRAEEHGHGGFDPPPIFGQPNGEVVEEEGLERDAKRELGHLIRHAVDEDRSHGHSQCRQYGYGDRHSPPFVPAKDQRPERRHREAAHDEGLVPVTAQARPEEVAGQPIHPRECRRYQQQELAAKGYDGHQPHQHSRTYQSDEGIEPRSGAQASGHRGRGGRKPHSPARTDVPVSLGRDFDQFFRRCRLSHARPPGPHVRLTPRSASCRVEPIRSDKSGGDTHPASDRGATAQCKQTRPGGGDQARRRQQPAGQTLSPRRGQGSTDDSTGDEAGTNDAQPTSPGQKRYLPG